MRILVTNDDGIGAELLGVGDHAVEGFTAGLFADLRERVDVAAENTLQAAR